MERKIMVSLRDQRKEAFKMMLLAILAVIGFIFFFLVLPAVVVVSLFLRNEE